MSKKIKQTPDWIIILIFLIILLVLGLNPIKAEEYTESREDAIRRHKKLTDLIAKKEALKIKLEKLFKRIYFFVRLIMIMFWFAALYVLYKIGLIKELGDALNYSEAFILVIVAIYFIIFGNISSLENFLENIKRKTENWVYGKHITLEERLEINKKELVVLEKKIEG